MDIDITSLLEYRLSSRPVLAFRLPLIRSIGMAISLAVGRFAVPLKSRGSMKSDAPLCSCES